MVDCGMAGLRAALTAPSGVDEAVILAAGGPSLAFRREGSRIGGGFEAGCAKSFAAEAAREGSSVDGSDERGT